MKINIDRLEKNISELKNIGLNPDDGGIYRVGYSAADMEGRKWFLEKAKQAGLEAHMDEIGNVFAKLESKNSSAKSFIVGSHLDSVPCGGNLDGALGVLVGLECLQTLKENNISLRDHIEVMGTAEEEGRFGGMIGTETFLGEMTQERIDNSKDSDDISMKEALIGAGLSPENALNAKRDTNTISGFLELHIEQGPVLEKKKMDIGIVEGISGIIHWRVKLEGECNHSGTTPMDMRKDAFQGLVDFSHSIDKVLEEFGTLDARASIGKVDIIPPNPHTIPGHVEFNVIIRDFTEEATKNLDREMRNSLESASNKRGLKFQINELSFIPPAYCHKELISQLEEVAKVNSYNFMRMPSGAGHDTQFFIKHVPATMFFIPSRKGISHSPEEHTDLDHIEKGANFMLDSLLSILK